MAIPLPRPGALLGLTRTAVDQALGSAVTMASVPARAFAVLDQVEALVRRIVGVVDRIEGTLDRTDRGLTQRRLAEPAHTPAYISTRESRRVRASNEALRHIAGRLGVGFEELASGRPPISPPA